MNTAHHNIEIGIDSVKTEVWQYVESWGGVALNVRLIRTVDVVALEKHSRHGSETVEIWIDVV